MSSASELSARQRKHVHMHSTIFSDEGPTTKSVYAPNRQKELYDNIKGTLKDYNYKPPDMNMPSAGDMKCTQNAGHGVVIPNGAAQGASQQPQSTPRMQRTTRDMLVHEGEARPVVHRGGKDVEAIPKEFWSTSVNLQWHDTRNEQCRTRANGPAAASADAMKRHQLSSEIFGKERLLGASTSNPRQDLLADTADHLRMDSQLQARGGGEGEAMSPNARARCQQNLSKSLHNTMPASAAQPEDRPQDFKNENPAYTDRRRSEKNFSDLFGTEMGERRDVRGNREEILGARNCHFLDSRCEIAGRNKGHWKRDEGATASDRKTDEGSSSLFDRSSPQRPSMDPSAAHQRHLERGCWECKDIMQTSSEIARRRRQKDHLKDFEDMEGHTHLSRKQEVMASSQVSHNFGGAPAPGWSASPRLSGSAAASRTSLVDERSAKDTKLASLQSSIFS